MDWIVHQLRVHPELAIFLTLFVGFWIGKIKIGNYSYIGENCMIMPGVTIGENCVIGGGSVVSRSVPDGVMVAGNPARFIGYTENFYNKIKNNTDMCCKGMNYYQKKAYLLSLSDDVFSHKGNVKIPE